MAVGFNTETLTGSPENFFETIVGMDDAVGSHPQMVNIDNAIKQAAASDDPSLQMWAQQMNEYFDQTAEAAAIRAEGGNDMIGSFVDRIKNVFAKIGELTRDGIQFSDLSELQAAWNASADPSAEARAAAQRALENAQSHLSAAGDDALEAAGIDKAKLDPDIDVATRRIDSLAPGAPAPGQS